MPELKYKRFERILCSVDFSEFSFWAYDQALAVVDRYRAQLLVQHVVETWRYPINNSRITPDGYLEYCDGLVKKGQDQLHEFVSSYPSDEVQIQPQCLTDLGVAAERILCLAEEGSVDLIVMGTHGRRGFDRLMMGSVTEEVLRKAPCPVLAGHLSAVNFETARQKRRDFDRLKFLLCTDFSEDARLASKYALSLTQEFDGDLTLLHVVEHNRRKSDTMTALRQRLAGLIPPGERKVCKVETAVRKGKAYEEIAQFASEVKANLVILAVQGHNASNRAVFGSTAYRVLQLGPCPVLVVRA
jgi:nucleotide-binding universal stress UspA family protein